MVTARGTGTGKILGLDYVDVDIEPEALGKIQCEIGEKTSGRAPSYHSNIGPVFQYKVIRQVVVAHAMEYLMMILIY
jgi:hypothetical protein